MLSFQFSPRVNSRGYKSSVFRAFRKTAIVRRCGWHTRVQRNKEQLEGEVEGEKEGCREMQIFARKLITRINSSQNIQTGCQTVRLHTPAPSQTPHILPPRYAMAVHRLAGVIGEHDRYNTHITCPPVFSAPANWLRTDLLDDFISTGNQKLPAALRCRQQRINSNNGVLCDNYIMTSTYY